VLLVADRETPEAARDTAIFRLPVGGERIHAETLMHAAVTSRLASAYRHGTAARSN